MAWRRRNKLHETMRKKIPCKRLTQSHQLEHTDGKTNVGPVLSETEPRAMVKLSPKLRDSSCEDSVGGHWGYP